MKNKLFVSTLVLLATTLSVSSFAEAKRRTRVDAVEDREVSAEAGASRFGFGFATYGTGGAVPSASTALSFWIDFNTRHSLQPFVGVTGSDPFTFGIGAIYRATLAGGQASGFHVGGGFNLGTMSGGAGSTPFFMNIITVAGFHFNAGSNVAFSFDGGPVFHVTPSPFVFSMLPTSAMGGASIHYMF